MNKPGTSYFQQVKLDMKSLCADVSHSRLIPVLINYVFFYFFHRESLASGAWLTLGGLPLLGLANS